MVVTNGHVKPKLYCRRCKTETEHWSIGWFMVTTGEKKHRMKCPQCGTTRWGGQNG